MKRFKPTRRKLFGLAIGAVASVGIFFATAPGISRTLDARHKRQLAAQFGIQRFTFADYLRNAWRSARLLACRSNAQREDDTLIRDFAARKPWAAPIGPLVTNQWSATGDNPIVDKDVLCAMRRQ